MCDLNQNGIIGKDELKMILQQRGFTVTEAEARALLMRFDRDDDSLVTWQEFAEEVRPKCLSKHLV